MLFKKSLASILAAGAIALGAGNKTDARDIAYLVKESPNPVVFSALNEIGYDFSVIYESRIPDVDFWNYDGILIQDNVANVEMIPFSKRSSIFLSKDIFDYVWPGANHGLRFNNLSPSRLIDFRTSMTEGFFNFDFQPYTSMPNSYFFNDSRFSPPWVNSLAISTSSPQNSYVSYSDVDDLRNVSFGFYQPNLWTLETKQLFKNSVKWVSETNPVPEPSTLGLLGSVCLVGAGAYVMRKKSGKNSISKV